MITILLKINPDLSAKKLRVIETNKLELISQYFCIFWKKYQQKFPIFATLARDILSISASGTGVERLFNCIYNIYYYRREQLKPETIKVLILHIYTTKFEIEQRKIDFTNQLISIGKSVFLEQKRDLLLPFSFLDSISNNKETEDKNTVTENFSQLLQPQAQNKNIRSKRSRNRSTQFQKNKVIYKPADLENI